MFLADQGAGVIKVEPLTGDINRRSRQTVDKAGEFSPLFISTNRGKRSIALDAKSPEGRAILMRLIAESDVLVQNFRPGAMARLGLAPEQLRERFPRLIYVSIDGVGDTGPYATKRVYDPLIQALSGMADVQSDPMTGRPRMIRTIIADKTTAVFSAQAITAALYRREKTGLGDEIKISMLDSMLAHIWPEGMMQYTVKGSEDLITDPNLRPDLIFQTLDGYITVGTISNAEWAGFCRATERVDLESDPRFNNPTVRSINGADRIGLMGELLLSRSTADWLSRLDAEDVPCAPVLRRNQVIDNEQVVARNLISEFDQPTVGRIRQPRPPARFESCNTSGQSFSPAPQIGEHSETILSGLGVSDGEIADLARRGVVKLGQQLSSSSEALT
jgi:crotonobetainyl-CoA:carnitine CoA-transferase CaiB-like acyl-CoA transferase